MNAAIFSRIRRHMNDRGIDCFAEPNLPPLDMGEDAVREAARALASLAEALGLEIAFSEFQPLFAQGTSPRSNTRIEIHLLNLQLATFRAMIILGYDFERMEAAMHRTLAQHLSSNPPAEPIPA